MTGLLIGFVLVFLAGVVLAVIACRAYYRKRLLHLSSSKPGGTSLLPGDIKEIEERVAEEVKDDAKREDILGKLRGLLEDKP